MADKNDDDWLTKSGPPEHDEDWVHIRRGVHKAHQSWLITGPLVAVAQNWKALAIVAGVVAWLNKPGILAALKTIFGGGI